MTLTSSYLALAAAALCANAQDVERPLAENVKWTSIWRAEAAIRLPIEDQPSSQTVSLPPLPETQGALTCLRFRARLHTERPAGWNNYLALVLNGTPVDRASGDGWPRVLNREPIFATTHPNYPEVDLVQDRNGFPCLQVFFGPPEPELADTLLTDTEEGYWYLLNIDDLVQEGQPNELALINTALREYWGGKPPEGADLIVDDLAVGAVPLAEVKRLRSRGYEGRRRLPGPALRGPIGTVRAVAGGGLQVEVGDETWFVESAFSFPRDPKMGLNRLMCLAETEGEEGWKPTAARQGERLTIQADGQWYRLQREAHWQGNRVTVEDSLTNLTDDVLGLAVQHSLITPEPARNVRLSGLQANAHGSGRFPENPTIFGTQARAGLGAVAEDNAMRLQMSTRAIANELCFRTDQLGLTPGETYTLRWALYPGSPDYFDFVNAVRRDWDVNYTVLGPFDFFDVRPLETEEGREAARQLLARKHMKLFALVPWFEYYNGWPYTRDEYRALMTSAMEFLRQVVPDAKLLACVETNLVPVSLTFFGDTIPDEGWPIGRDIGGKYGQTATPEMTAKVEASPWRDSCIREADGNVVLDCWYVQHYKERPALNLMVYPEIGNHRHAHMLEQLGWLLDEVGFDGVYIDQFSMAYSTGRDRYTRERWDGCTLRLDASGRVQEKIADLGLVSAPARREWVEFVLGRGKTVVCNSQPAVEELQSLRTFRFMETQGYDPLQGDGPPLQPRLAKGQLHSPIGLGHSFPSTAGADFFMRTLIAHLRFGLLYYCYSTNFPPDGERGGEFGPLNHMFPFTPIELHEGWVLGQERLITCVSGDFPWPHAQRPRVLQFDSRGRECPAEAQIKRDGDGFRVSVELRDWWEVAVVLPEETAK
jgi:hypothetical protein